MLFEGTGRCVQSGIVQIRRRGNLALSKCFIFVK